MVPGDIETFEIQLPKLLINFKLQDEIQLPLNSIHFAYEEASALLELVSTMGSPGGRDGCWEPFGLRRSCFGLFCSLPKYMCMCVFMQIYI